MKKYKVIIISFSVLIFICSYTKIHASEKVLSSKIVSVKLYQNQAKIIRTVKVTLNKGTNKVVIGGLSKLLYDWSVKREFAKKIQRKNYINGGFKEGPCKKKGRNVF